MPQSKLQDNVSQNSEILRYNKGSLNKKVQNTKSKLWGSQNCGFVMQKLRNTKSKTKTY